MLRYFGLKGHFGITGFTFQEELKAHSELFKLLRDHYGRPFFRLHIRAFYWLCDTGSIGRRACLPLIKDGDEIEIDIPKRKMNLLVSDEENRGTEKEFQVGIQNGRLSALS